MVFESHFNGAETPTNIHRSMALFLSIARLHITAIAALGVFTFGWLFMGVYPWFLAAVCALDWSIVNLINRIVDLKEDLDNAIRGTFLVQEYRRFMLIAAFGFLLVSIITLHILNPAITALRIFGHMLGILYNWPILPAKKRLKQLYFWKNTASGIGFLITVFGYPLATLIYKKYYIFPPGITWTTVVFSAVFFFLFIQSYEIIYDLRDIQGDRLAGIQTYPVVHGDRIAVYLIDGLILSSVVVLVVGYCLSVVPWRIFVMIGAPFIQLLVYKPAQRRGITTKDCIRITWLGSALFFIYHVWIIAGLPGSSIR